MTSNTPSPMVYLSPPQSEDYVMNTRTYGIGNNADQSDSAVSHRDQAPLIVELGTVSNETKTGSIPVVLDSPNHIGTFGA